MLRTIGVENYRTFPDGSEFDIAPVTILLGANSSGKSSITRLLPLFAQSLTRKTSAPILWVSDNLDYGSFYDNVHNHDTSKDITLTFRGDFRPAARYSRIAPSPPPQSDTPFCYKISIKGDNESTSISSIDISLYGKNVRIPSRLGGLVRQVFFDGWDAKEIMRDRLIIFRDGLFPGVIFVRRSDKELEIVESFEFLIEAAKILKKYAHANTSVAKIAGILSVIPLSSPLGIVDAIEKRSVGIPSLKRRVSRITPLDRDRIWFCMFMAGLDSTLSAIKLNSSSDILAGAYLGPIRARASRYYRRQELAVEQIDSTGENLAMYLNSLREHERDEINRDLSNFFGHRINVHPGEGHISLRISAVGDSHEDNLADVGFGFSQLLPVIAQVHAASRSHGAANRLAPNVRSVSPILAVEQPELHLHPAYQAKLGSYFVHAATSHQRGGPAFRFLIETHSEPLVNEVAAQVARGAIMPDDVRIYLFERKSGDSFSTVLRAEINSDGTIDNWPFGFFSSGRIRSPGRF